MPIDKPPLIDSGKVQQPSLLYVGRYDLVLSVSSNDFWANDSCQVFNVRSIKLSLQARKIKEISSANILFVCPTMGLIERITYFPSNLPL